MDEFEEASKRLPKPGTKSWYERLPFDDEQRAKLDAALADENIGARAISVVLQRWGYTVNPEQIRHYRRRSVAS